jgi:putative tricarboxylic transport membrane protein
MEHTVLQNVLYGFQVTFQPGNFLYCFIGVLIGTLVGVLPGLGPGAAISLLIPATLKIPPAASIIMLAGIYYGAMYGGSTTSILVNIPGEASSVVTCLDGYQMARKGRAGAALGISAFGSFIGGSLSVLGIILLAPPLASLALRFGPPEYFSLILLGLVMISFMASGSIIKASMMGCLGLLIGSIGMDEIVGSMRFVYGIPILENGVGIVPAIMGLFGISEVLLNIERHIEQRDIFRTTFRGLLPNWQEWKRSIKPILRGTMIGFGLGTLPGGGAIISSFASYTIEKRSSKYPEKFGTGLIEGVAGPETANNSAISGALIPLLTLGVPCNSVIAIIAGALIIHGVDPGPLLIKEAPDVFWGVISSMYLGNMMLLILNLPLIGIWVKILKVPYLILFPLILLFCLIGAYSLNYNTGEVLIMIIFGVMGYLMKKYKYEATPLILALVLGTRFEMALRRSLLISYGDFSVFVTRPISAGLLAVAAILMTIGVIYKHKLFKERVEDE